MKHILPNISKYATKEIYGSILCPLLSRRQSQKKSYDFLTLTVTEIVVTKIFAEQKRIFLLGKVAPLQRKGEGNDSVYEPVQCSMYFIGASNEQKYGNKISTDFFYPKVICREVTSSKAIQSLDSN